MRDNVFLKHDLNIFNYLIQLNRELERRGAAVGQKSRRSISRQSPTRSRSTRCPGPINVIDLQTAIEIYTPAYAMLLTDRDFWRAANSLQLDETIGLYARG